jgi:hypothetical protein
MLVHYIIVRVEEEHPDSAISYLARVRRAIHAVAREYGIEIADFASRADCQHIFGTKISNRYQEIDDWFTAVMRSASSQEREE